MFKSIVILFVLNSAHLVFGADQIKTIEIRETTLQVFELIGWQEVDGFHGGDKTWIGPETSGPRPVIKLDITKKKKWSLESEKDSIETYLNHKKEWLNKKNGKLNSHRLGQSDKDVKYPHLYNHLNYSLNSVDYIEEDWLIKCPDTLINISFLVTTQRMAQVKDKWNSFTSTLNCP